VSIGIYTFQIVRIACVSQSIVIDNLAIRITLERDSDEGRPDESSASRNEKSLHSMFQLFLFLKVELTSMGAAGFPCGI
jgi:hypothetical protein